MKFGKVHLILVPVVVALVAIFLVSVAEAGRGGGGGGGGGGRGGGGRGGTGKSGGGGSKLSTGKKVGLVAAGGVASYAAYRGYRASHPKNKDKDDRDRDSPDLDSVGWDGGYNVQGRTAYSRGEGGMSALGIILLVLAIIGVGFVLWCCYNVVLPCWRDKQSKRNRTLSFSHVISSKGDDMPLRETPSTASPSP